MSRVEKLALRLATIQDELLALPEGPSPERYQLLIERDRLRDEAFDYATETDSDRSTEELESELIALQDRRKGIISSRTGYAMGGDSNQVGVGGAWVKLSVLARSAAGLDHLNARISKIEDVLAARIADSG